MAKIIMSFDVEDYINKIGVEGIIRCAKILEEYKVRGCFCIVARLAETLLKWGRQDCIDAIKSYHEIDYHSLDHSLHPTIDDYTDLVDYSAAAAQFRRKEMRGVDIVKQIFGVDKLYCALPPGNCTSYVAQYEYAKMGFKVYAGSSIFDNQDCRQISFCNMETPHYAYYLGGKFFTETDEALDKWIEEMATKQVICLAHHPMFSYVTLCPDEVNFNGFNVPENEWKESPRRPIEETELFFKRFRWLVETLKNDDRFEFITYEDVEKDAERQRIIKIDDLPQIRRQLEEDWYPVTSPDSYCIADIFDACRTFLNGGKEHKCGFVHGFLTTPYCRPESVTLTKAQLLDAVEFIDESEFLPEFLYADGVKIGPADWLRAALQILTDGGDKTTINPGPAVTSLIDFPYTKTFHYRSWMNDTHLEDLYLSDRFRLQDWTLRLPRESERHFLKNE